jgi:hypothetical protein
VVAQKRLPTLRRRSPVPPHILGYGRLADSDAPASRSPRRSARSAPSYIAQQISADRCCRRSAAWVISAAGH